MTQSTRTLALNALIEAQRAGEAGRVFAIFAEEVRVISDEVREIARPLYRDLSVEIAKLESMTRKAAEDTSDKRLVDLAQTSIELIDRNLYERRCDVRWWATDVATVDCAASATAESMNFASRRLRVILNACIVYLDLWLCDRNGRVIANGRPDRYAVTGHDVAREPWFKQALATRSADAFGSADVEINRERGDRPAATFTAAVRKGGDPHGCATGVLGIHFDWRPQAQTIVENPPINPGCSTRAAGSLRPPTAPLPSSTGLRSRPRAASAGATTRMTTTSSASRRHRDTNLMLACDGMGALSCDHARITARR